MSTGYCYGCMRKLETGQSVCPFCGHDNSRKINKDMSLLEGTLLQDGKFLVGKVLGIGGFGITYLGLDTKLGIRIAVKEYFPQSQKLCSRIPYSKNVIISEGEEKKYQRGQESFEAEARTLAIFNSPGIVHVREFFSENNTTYIVMDYAEGIGLDEEIERCGGRMQWQRVVSLMLPLMKDLDRVHRQHVIHRDIKPANIRIVRETGGGNERLMLLDFGAARNFVSSELSGTFTAILTPGFAPPEQYLQHTHLGPYTDIYSLCATMYKAITGANPPAAPDRMYGNTPLKPFSFFGLNVPEYVEKAVFHGMENNWQQRPQSLYELYQELIIPQRPAVQKPKMEQDPSGQQIRNMGQMPYDNYRYAQQHANNYMVPPQIVDIANPQQVVDPAVPQKKEAKPKKTKSCFIILGIIIIVLILIAVFIVYIDHNRLWCDVLPFLWDADTCAEYVR